MNKKLIDIDNITEKEAATLSTECMVIKGYNVYFVDLPYNFGYSYLVYKNNHHIRFADDFGMHHKYTVEKHGLEYLRNYYIEQLNNKLFTEEEIGQPLRSYDEYEAKRTFLSSYYAMQHDYVSEFRIFRPGTDDEERFDEEVKDLIYNPAGMCYMAKELKPFIDHHVELKRTLNAQKADVANNFDYQKNAFMAEMYNHEYNYTFDDEAVLTAFGLPYHRDYPTLEQCFDKLNFTQVQRDAYRVARIEVKGERKVA